jgi:hypothetical protein
MQNLTGNTHVTFLLCIADDSRRANGRRRLVEWHLLYDPKLYARPLNRAKTLKGRALDAGKLRVMPLMANAANKGP